MSEGLSSTDKVDYAGAGSNSKHASSSGTGSNTITSSSSSTASAQMAWLLLASVFFASANTLLYKITLNAFSSPTTNYGFFISQFSTLLYTFQALAISIFIVIRDYDSFAQLMKIPQKVYVYMGALDSASATLGAIAGVSCPGELQTILNQMIIPMTMIGSAAFLKTKFQSFQIWGSVFIVVGAVVALSDYLFSAGSDSAINTANVNRQLSGDIIDHTSYSYKQEYNHWYGSGDTYLGSDDHTWTAEPGRGVAADWFTERLLSETSSIGTGTGTGTGTDIGTGTAGVVSITAGVAILVYFISVIPSAASNIYKEGQMKEADMDEVHTTTLVSFWQLLIGFLSLPLMSLPALGGLTTGQMQSQLNDGFICFWNGHNPEDPEHNSCQSAAYFLIAYIVVNFIYNLLMLVITKRGSAVLLVISQALSLPVTNIAFTLRVFMGDAAEPLTIVDLVGLVLVCIGFLTYSGYGFANNFMVAQGPPGQMAYVHFEDLSEVIVSTEMALNPNEVVNFLVGSILQQSLQTWEKDTARKQLLERQGLVVGKRRGLTSPPPTSFTACKHALNVAKEVVLLLEEEMMDLSETQGGGGGGGGGDTEGSGFNNDDDTHNTNNNDDDAIDPNRVSLTRERSNREVKQRLASLTPRTRPSQQQQQQQQQQRQQRQLEARSAAMELQQQQHNHNQTQTQSRSKQAVNEQTPLL